MPRPFPEKRDGSTLEPRDLNWAYRFLWRLRRMTGSEGVSVHEADSAGDPYVTLDASETMHAQLTGPWDSTNLGYPWQEVNLCDGRLVQLTGRTGTTSGTGADPAFERRINDMTLTADGTVYLMRRSPASGQWVFPHRASMTFYRICVTIQDCNADNDPHVTGITITGPDGFSTTFDPGMLVSNSYFCIDVPGTGSYTVDVTSSVYPETTITVTVTGSGVTYATMCMGGYGPVCSYVTSCGGPVGDVTVHWQCGDTDLGTSVSFFTTETSCKAPDGTPLPPARIAQVCSPCRPTNCTLVGTVVEAPMGFATGQTVSFPAPAFGTQCTGGIDWACQNGGTGPLGFILGPADGYGELCCLGIMGYCTGMTGSGQPILIPIQDPLFITDPWYGNVTLTYQTIGGDTAWFGSLVVTCSEFNGCPLPQPRTFTVTYRFGPSGIGAGGCSLTACVLGFANVFNGGCCPDDGGTSEGGGCHTFALTLLGCPPGFSAQSDEFANDGCVYQCVNPAAAARVLTISQ